MARVFNINFFSLNVSMSTSLAGLAALVSAERLDILFLQEVRMTSLEIESLLPGFHAVANVDPENLSTPGTAIAWRGHLPVEEVTSFVMCRMQIASMGPYRLVNIYAPSGTNRKKERAVFLGRISLKVYS